MRLLIAGLLLSGLALMGAEVPRQSPEYALTLPGGQQELLSKYKGKVVAMEFLFTTCPHCQKSATFCRNCSASTAQRVSRRWVSRSTRPGSGRIHQPICDGFSGGKPARVTRRIRISSSRSCRRIFTFRRWYSSIRKA